MVGIAPINRDSGVMQGRRTTWGGRADIRVTLYMVALVASRNNLPISGLLINWSCAGSRPRSR